ncbi:MAG: phosphatase PAP2 family protein [Ignavibacteriales bacterium]
MMQASHPLTVVVVAITTLGSPNFLMGVILAVYWCSRRTTGLKAGVVWLVSMWLNSVLKIVLRIPRPESPVSSHWWSALVEVEGYGFPSGHAMATATLWWTLAWAWGNRLLYYLGVLFTALVGASRVYLRAHYLADVVGGGALGIAVASLAAHGISWLERRGYRLRATAAVTLAAAASGMAMLGPLDSFVAKSAGFFLGFVAGGVLEPVLGGVSRNAVPLVQAVKTAFGVVIVLTLSAALKHVLPETVTGVFWRYAAMGAAATFVMPALFVITRLSKIEARR